MSTSDSDDSDFVNFQLDNYRIDSGMVLVEKTRLVSLIQTETESSEIALKYAGLKKRYAKLKYYYYHTRYESQKITDGTNAPRTTPPPTPTPSKHEITELQKNNDELTVHVTALEEQALHNLKTISELEFSKDSEQKSLEDSVSRKTVENELLVGKNSSQKKLLEKLISDIKVANVDLGEFRRKVDEGNLKIRRLEIKKGDMETLKTCNQKLVKMNNDYTIRIVEANSRKKRLERVVENQLEDIRDLKAKLFNFQLNFFQEDYNMDLKVSDVDFVDENCKKNKNTVEFDKQRSKRQRWTKL